MTAKIEKFLDDVRPPTPCLVVDLDVVAERCDQLRAQLPVPKIYYAVKANPAPQILRLLGGKGISFDVASVSEIDLCLGIGISPERLSYGNTIKKAGDIAYAYEKGIRLFAFDSEEELDKLAGNAPGARVMCRVIVPNRGAEWPLTRKFGCEPQMAHDLLLMAEAKGLKAHGLSFHVGSQQTNPDAWDMAVELTARLFRDLEASGVRLELLNLGGGLPAHYKDPLAGLQEYSLKVMHAVTRHFGNDLPGMMIEPGRYLVADAGVIQSEVVLISRKSYDDPVRWVYLDIGRFGGLAETEGEAIRYPLGRRVSAANDNAAEAERTGPVILAGPTCDSADILYEKSGYQMPLDLKVGDKIEIRSTGAYTTTYSSVGFNGFAPLKAYYI